MFVNHTSLLKQEEAEAIIIDMQQTGLYINDAPQIKLQMQVVPGNGRNFIMETHYVVKEKELDNFKLGSRLKVKFFSGDKQKMPLIA